MKRRSGAPAGRGAELARRLVLAMLAISLAGLGIVAVLAGRHPGVGRCEGQGGYFIVGPGGETLCVSRRTLLPLPGDEVPPARR